MMILILPMMLASAVPMSAQSQQLQCVLQGSEMVCPGARVDDVQIGDWLTFTLRPAALTSRVLEATATCRPPKTKHTYTIEANCRNEPFDCGWGWCGFFPCRKCKQRRICDPKEITEWQQPQDMPHDSSIPIAGAVGEEVAPALTLITQTTRAGASASTTVALKPGRPVTVVADRPGAVELGVDVSKDAFPSTREPASAEDRARLKAMSAQLCPAGHTYVRLGAAHRKAGSGAMEPLIVDVTIRRHRGDES